MKFLCSIERIAIIRWVTIAYISALVLPVLFLRYGNIIGCIKGKKNGLKVLMDGHMDTVPVQEEKWRENAFGGEIKDGKIYGRGTSDMKGALISMALAGAYFAEDNTS